MKITKIQIGNYHQFKDFDLPLIYPEGHSKAGQPLEKVCFIGQSGTGKTSLLEILYGMTGNTSRLKGKYSAPEKGDEIKVNIRLFDLTYVMAFQANWSKQATEFKRNKNNITANDFIKVRSESMDKIKTHLIHFPADLFLDFGTPDESLSMADNDEKHIYDFSIDKAISVWKLILSDIQKYQETELKLRQDISKAVESNKGVKGIEDVLSKLRNWKASTLNPIEEIAENCLNILLKYFKLHVKTELDFQKKEDIGFIKIADLRGNEIPNGLLSTGTKQIVLTGLPLYLLKPNNTVVLFDEPERSLFPDMQRIIVDYYSSFVKTSQFFYATHSPIVASSFEPCERIILYFDETGHVKWKYGVAPIGDDPNDLLKKDFEMASLMNEKGIEQYKKYLDYKIQIKNEKDPKKKEDLVIELTKLGEQYDF